MWGRGNINLNAQDMLKDTPLHLAAWHGNLEMFCTLFVLGADVTYANGLEQRPMEVVNEQLSLSYLGEGSTAAIRAIKYILAQYQRFLRNGRNKKTLPDSSMDDKKSYNKWIARYLICLRENILGSRIDYTVNHLCAFANRFILELRLLVMPVTKRQVRNLLDILSG